MAERFILLHRDPEDCQEGESPEVGWLGPEAIGNTAKTDFPRETLIGRMIMAKVNHTCMIGTVMRMAIPVEVWGGLQLKRKSFPNQFVIQRQAGLTVMIEFSDKQFEQDSLHDARIEEFLVRGDCVQLRLKLDTGKRLKCVLEGVRESVARGSTSYTIIDEFEVLKLNSMNVYEAIRTMRELDADAIRGTDQSASDTWTRDGLIWVKVIPSQGMAFQAVCRAFSVEADP
jgi:hypothetical protein